MMAFGKKISLPGKSVSKNRNVHRKENRWRTWSKVGLFRLKGCSIHTAIFPNRKIRALLKATTSLAVGDALQETNVWTTTCSMIIPFRVL